MTSPYDETDFVDTDFQAAKKKAYALNVPSATTTSANPNRPPTREEIESKVTDTQQRLADLKKAQEELERERATLEEARRRQSEFQTGRQEMIQHLTRGLGLLEQAEFAARRDAEQMAKSMADLRDALANVQGIHEEAWTKENWNVELTRALTAIENARLEWNSSRLKWPVLSEPAAAAPGPPAPATAVAPLLAEENFGRLCRIGFALTWPLLVAGLAIFLVLLLR